MVDGARFDRIWYSRGPAIYPYTRVAGYTFQVHFGSIKRCWKVIDTDGLGPSTRRQDAHSAPRHVGVGLMPPPTSGSEIVDCGVSGWNGKSTGPIGPKKLRLK